MTKFRIFFFFEDASKSAGLGRIGRSGRSARATALRGRERPGAQPAHRRRAHRAVQRERVLIEQRERRGAGGRGDG